MKTIWIKFSVSDQFSKIQKTPTNNQQIQLLYLSKKTKLKLIPKKHAGSNRGISVFCLQYLSLSLYGIIDFE